VTSPPLCVRNIRVRLCYRPISVPHFTCLTLVCLLTLSSPKLRSYFSLQLWYFTFYIKKNSTTFHTAVKSTAMRFFGTKMCSITVHCLLTSTRFRHVATNERGKLTGTRGVLLVMSTLNSLKTVLLVQLGELTCFQIFRRVRLSRWKLLLASSCPSVCPMAGISTGFQEIWYWGRKSVE